MTATLIGAYLTSTTTLPPTASTVLVSTNTTTPPVGTVVVVKASSQGSQVTIQGISGGGLTWTSQLANADNNQCPARVWTAVVATSAAVTPQVTFKNLTGTTGTGLFVVEYWSGAVLGDNPVTSTSVSTDVSGTISTVGVDSMVTWMDADWMGVSGPITLLSPAVLSKAKNFPETQITFYSAFQAAALPGDQTFGVSAPGGQKGTLAAIELLAAPATNPAPGQVTGVTIATVTSTSVSLAWAATPKASTYQVQTRPATTGVWSSTRTTQNTSALLTNLTPSTTYSIRVIASNDAGSGAESVTATVTTPAPAGTAPAAPQGLTVVSVSSTTVALTWAASATATSYLVESRTAAGAWRTAANSTGTSVTVASLVANTTYTFRVSAVNTAGPGLSSTAVSAATTNSATPTAVPAVLGPVVVAQTATFDVAEATALLAVSLGIHNYSDRFYPCRVHLMAINGTSTVPGIEVQGGSYSAQAVTWAEPASGAVANASTVVFTGLPATTIAGIELWSTAPIPQRKWFGPINTGSSDPVTVAANDIAQLPAGQIVLAIVGASAATSGGTTPPPPVVTDPGFGASPFGMGPFGGSG